MQKLLVRQSNPLMGSIKISGSKNSILPIIVASLLANGETILNEVPYLNDVVIMTNLIEVIGAKIEFSTAGEKMRIIPTGNFETTAPYELVNKLRASFLVMAPLLAKCGYAKIPMPGGCQIGSRPVDLHLKGFSAMGAEITTEFGFIEAKVNGRLKGSRIYLDFPSVGATQNIMMAATLAEGQTIIENAATEPEIVDLAHYLILTGADIKGAGTDTIKIIGVSNLQGTLHTIIPDRIEAGTFMIAAALTQGDVLIENVVPEHLKPVTAKLNEAGVIVEEFQNAIRVKATGRVTPTDIKTHPYPGFPTDMQSQFSTLLSCADGTSLVTETIFENRFMHINELKRMGANIKIEGRTCIIEGVENLSGAEVRATDLRGGAALVLAGLKAEGETVITDIEHIDRGYVKIEEKFKKLGANIERVED